MKSYCVKQRKMTSCVPGSEKYVVTKNGRNAMKCVCSECGITKFRFVSGKQGAGLASATKDLRRKASNYLMSENTRNKIKQFGHRNLDKAVDSATYGIANKLSSGSGLKRTRKRKGKGLLLGKNSPFNKIPLTGAIL